MALLLEIASRVRSRLNLCLGNNESRLRLHFDFLILLIFVNHLSGVLFVNRTIEFLINHFVWILCSCVNAFRFLVAGWPWSSLIEIHELLLTWNEVSFLIWRLSVALKILSSLSRILGICFPLVNTLLLLLMGNWFFLRNSLILIRALLFLLNVIRFLICVTLLIAVLICLFLFLTSTQMLIVLIISILYTRAVILGLSMMILNSSCFLRSASNLLLTSYGTLNSCSRLKLFTWLRSRFLRRHTPLSLILLNED